MKYIVQRALAGKYYDWAAFSDLTHAFAYRDQMKALDPQPNPIGSVPTSWRVIERTVTEEIMYNS